MLKDYPEVRKVVYNVFTVLGIVLGAIQVGIAALAAAQPDWLTVSLAVYAFLGGALGITASTNVNPAPGGDDAQ
jgi:heme O synthase-like polyprenyltransferase